jgi:hypothetical protein
MSPVSTALRTGLLVTALAASCSRPQPADGGSQRPLPPTSAGAATSAGTSAAAVDPRLRERLVGPLSGFENTLSKEELTRLGSPPALVSALTSIYQDTALEPFVRINALTSLRFFPGPQSRAVLEGTLTSGETSDPARRAAVKAYGEAFGPEAVPILDRMLDHPELHTRNAAAVTLAEMHDPKARQALERRLPQEKEPLVRKTIESGLARGR